MEWILKIFTLINPIKLWNTLRQTDKIKELNKETLELRQKLIKFENPEIAQRELEFKDNIYYEKSTNETFCSRCWDSEHKKIHLVDGGNPDYWHCKNCSNHYKKPNIQNYNRYSPPPPNMGMGFKS